MQISTCCCQQGGTYSSWWNHKGSKENGSLSNSQTYRGTSNGWIQGLSQKFIRLHAEPGSIIISWVFPKELSGELEQLAHDNAAIFDDFGVVEVTVWRSVPLHSAGGKDPL